MVVPSSATFSVVNTLAGPLFCQHERFDVNKLHFICKHVAFFVSNLVAFFITSIAASSMRGGVMKLLSTLGPFGSCVVLMVPVIACAAQKTRNIS
jgi:hypothetical protein